MKTRKTVLRLLGTSRRNNNEIAQAVKRSKQRVSQIARSEGWTREGDFDATKRCILALCGGKQTFDDIANIVDRSPESVKYIVHQLRREGHECKVKRKPYGL